MTRARATKKKAPAAPPTEAAKRAHEPFLDEAHHLVAVIRRAVLLEVLMRQGGCRTLKATAEVVHQMLEEAWPSAKL